MTIALTFAACSTEGPGSEPGEVLTVTAAVPERVGGDYERDGIRFSFDAVKTDATTRVVVHTAEGAELLRLEKQGDLLITSAYGGRAKVITNLAMLKLSAEMAAIPEDQRPDFSLEGAVVEEGDPRAFTDLEQSPEYALLPWASRELGRQGFTGKAYPATLGFHMIAMQASRTLAIDLPPLAIDPAQVGNQEIGYCLDLRSDPYGDGAYGMCGPGTSCWDWVCGDCCCHDGCKSHDKTCRECKWYKPWNCFLCATFTSFIDGGCGTSCQGRDYAEPACRNLGEGCSQNSDCCNHYPDANEAAAGAQNVICGSGACRVEGTCYGNCGANAGWCWCDAACSSYGDCCPDVAPACGYGGGGGGSCYGYCGTNAGGCWCDAACTTYGDCCADSGPACGVW